MPSTSTSKSKFTCSYICECLIYFFTHYIFCCCCEKRDYYASRSSSSGPLLNNSNTFQRDYDSLKAQESNSRSSSSNCATCEPNPSSKSETVNAPSPFDHLNIFDKICAGVVYMCEGEILLILRNSNYNDRTWDFSGGQIDPEDFDIFFKNRNETYIPKNLPYFYDIYDHVKANVPAVETDKHFYGFSSPTWKAALRESMEEINSPIAFKSLGSLKIHSIYNIYRTFWTKRYTLYICVLTAAQRDKFIPALSEEHVAWGWFPVETITELQRRNQYFELHPWVEAFVDLYPKQFQDLAYTAKFFHIKKKDQRNISNDIRYVRKRHPKDAASAFLDDSKYITLSQVSKRS